VHIAGSGPNHNGFKTRYSRNTAQGARETSQHARVSHNPIRCQLDALRLIGMDEMRSPDRPLAGLGILGVSGREGKVNHRSSRRVFPKTAYPNGRGFPSNMQTEPSIGLRAPPPCTPLRPNWLIRCPSASESVADTHHAIRLSIRLDVTGACRLPRQSKFLALDPNCATPEPFTTRLCTLVDARCVEERALPPCACFPD